MFQVKRPPQRCRLAPGFPQYSCQCLLSWNGGMLMGCRVVSSAASGKGRHVECASAKTTRVPAVCQWQHLPFSHKDYMGEQSCRQSFLLPPCSSSAHRAPCKHQGHSCPLRLIISFPSSLSCVWCHVLAERSYEKQPVFPQRKTLFLQLLWRVALQATENTNMGLGASL